MAEITFLNKQHIAVTTTASTSKVELTSYTIDWTDLTGAGFGNGDDVIIIITGRLCGNDFNYKTLMDIRIGTSGFASSSVVAELELQPDSSSESDGSEWMWMDRRTLATNEDIFFGGSTENVAATAGFRNFSALILKLDDLGADDFRYDEQTHSGAAPSTFDTSGASITFPSTGGDDWLMWSHSEWNVEGTSTQYIHTIDFGNDGTNLAECSMEGETTASHDMIGSILYQTGVTASKVARADYRRDDTANAHECTRTAIFALRMEAFAEHDGDYNTTAHTLSVVDTFVECAGLPTYSHNETNLCIVAFVSGDINATDSSKRLQMRVQVGGTDWVTDYGTLGDHPARDVDDHLVMYYQTVKSQATGTLDIDLDAAETNDVDPTYDVTSSTLVAFSMELAGTESRAGLGPFSVHGPLSIMKAPYASFAGKGGGVNLIGGSSLVGAGNSPLIGKTGGTVH
jgi:hypothetical protein